MIGGRLGDIFGYELMLKIGMFFFNAFTLLCALVPDKIGLVVGRALQGKSIGKVSLHVAAEARRDGMC